MVNSRLYAGLVAVMLNSCFSKPDASEEELHSGIADAVNGFADAVKLALCGSLDLQQKLGFETSFVSGGMKLCYGINSNDNSNFFEYLGPCAKDAGDVGFVRYFAGSEKGKMEMTVILNSNGDYLPFWRDSSGKITSMIFTPVPEEAPKFFDFGASELDKVKRKVDVCEALLKYTPE